MKTPMPLWLRRIVPAFALALGSLVIASTLQAQAAPVTKPASQAAAKDEAVELSPFIVNSDDDNGYAPTETLAGTRLRTETKNVASAMSIITAEMLRDMGATSFFDVVDFLPNTFAYGSNEGDATANGLRTGTPFMVRGYRSDSLSTNFFTASMPIDSYNTSRMTFTRGPNSILFGIGNPGGAIDIASNRAELAKNFRRLDLRVDSYGSFRTSADANTVLVPNKLGLRVDLLHDDRRMNIQPSRDKRDSIYGTFTWQPARNSVLYLNLESNHRRTNIPYPYEMYDWYNTWAAAGRPIKAVAKNTAAGPGWEFQSGNGYPVVIPGIGVMNWASMAFGARPVVVRSGTSSREGKISYGEGSPNRIVPLDTNIVGNGNFMNYDNENYTVIFQQRLAPNLHLEIGAKHDHNWRMNRETDGNIVAMMVDPNAQLPNGAPNPFVGMPFVEVQPNRQQIQTDVNQVRVTLSYEKDLTRIKVFGRGLGRLSFGGLYNNEATHQYLEQYREVNETPATSGSPFIADLSDTRNRIHRRWYFVPGQANYFNFNFDPVSGNGIQTGWELADATPRNNFSRTKSYSFAGQALLLDDLLALTGGLRRDELFTSSMNYFKDARGVWGDAHTGTLATPLNGVGRPYLYGIVLNAHRNVSLYYNRAINFRSFNQSNRTIDGSLIPTQAGRGLDTGVKFSLLENRVTGSVGYFETSQTNILNGNLREKKAGWINSIWEVIDRTKNPDLIVPWQDLKDTKTHGVEIQLVANPTKNLRFMANAGREINVLQNQGSVLFAYLDRNYPIWQANAATRLQTSTSDGVVVGDLIPKIKAEVADDKAAIGQKQTKVYEWTSTFIGRYQFDRGSALKGFAAGSAVRYRTAPILGFARVNGTGIFDLSRPYKGTASSNLDAWVEYGRTFTFRDRKVRWSAEVRAQNLLDDRTLLPFQADDLGNGQRYVQQRRTPGERQLSVRSTFDF